MREPKPKCVLVTGGRDYRDDKRVFDELDLFNPDFVIEGGATGADAMARKWAEQHGVHYATVPALWSAHGKPAGPRRNAVMVTLLKALETFGYECRVIAFPGGPGTRSCVSIAEERELFIKRIED